MSLKKIFATVLISSAVVSVNAGVFEDSIGGERDVFSAFDGDGDGKISMTELVEGMVHLVGKDRDGDHYISRRESRFVSKPLGVFDDSIGGERDVFSIFDSNDDNKVSMTELVEGMIHAVATDKDGDHFLSREELGVFQDSIGGEADVFSVFDIDKDGKVSMTEVIEVMVDVVKRDKDGDHVITRGEKAKGYGY